MTNLTVSKPRDISHRRVRKAIANASTFDSLPSSGYLRQSQLIPGVVPFSSATLWRKCKAGQFPKPVKLSERITAWNVGSVVSARPTHLAQSLQVS